MSELMMMVNKADSNLGPSELIAGDPQLGYYGRFLDTELNGNTLAGRLGVTEGTAANVGTEWFKFAFNGKTIYTPVKPIRYAISWNHLYLKGIVYGDGTTGLYQGSITTVQNTRLNIKGKEYIVRLFHGANSNPCPTALYNQVTTQGVDQSEYNKLFGNIYFQGTALFESLNNTDIGYSTGNTNGVTVCIEKHSYATGAKVYRGFNGNAMGLATNNSYLYTGSTEFGYSSVWRPILELVE